MKFSRIMRNFTPAALAIAKDLYKEDHIRIIIGKYSASRKLKPKQKLCEMDYVSGKFIKVYKLWYQYQ